MSKQREALEMALDTLRGWIGIDEWIWPVTAKKTCKKNSLEAITAIREALAEPEPWTPDDMAYRPGGLSMSAEQEPVAHHSEDDLDMVTRKPLTDSEVFNLAADYYEGYGFKAAEFARAIERAHGIGSD